MLSVMNPGLPRLGGGRKNAQTGSIRCAGAISRSAAEPREERRGRPQTRIRIVGAPALVTRTGTGEATREYGAKQTIFSQGDPADAVFYIQTGQVKLTVVSLAGKEAVIGILDEGAFFGEGCLAAQPRRTYTASAVAGATIVRLESQTMTARLHRNPRFAESFTAYLLARNGRLEEDLVDQLFNSSEKRLARLLLLLAHFGEAARPESIPKLSQETLAGMIGTTRSRVSFFMNRFRDRGFIDYSDGLTVHSSLLSVVLRD